MSRRGALVARSESESEYRPESMAPDAPILGKRLAAAGDVFADLKDLLGDEKREHFMLYTMTVRHQIITRHTIAIGCLTGVEVHPREVFRPAILDAAAAVILAHNHPSGDPKPSREDVVLTSRLREVGQLVGITVLDHVIVTKTHFISLAERGWV